MKRLFSGISAAVISVLLLFSSCSVPGLGSGKSTLRVGVENMSGSCNPFYFDEERDGLIMTQVFETLRRPGNGKLPQKLCGSITHEQLDDGKIKFTVTVDEGICFSDGTAATIDDIIFYYHVLSDASFDGNRGTWLENDIVGLREYYYDDMDWKKNLAVAEESGTDAKSYIEKNYADGTDVAEISGISKIDDYSCTILFNSVNVDSLGSIEPLIVSKAVYGAGYVKGNADAIKNNTSAPTGTGPYCFDGESRKKGETVLKANEYYHGGAPGFDYLRFVKTTNGTAAKALAGGKVDVIELPALQSDINTVSEAGFASFFSDCGSYVSMIFNCERLPADLRLGLMRLTDRTLGLENYFGSHFTALYRPLSVGFAEYPAEASDFPFESEEASSFFERAGYTRNEGEIGKDRVIADENGAQLSVHIVCREDESEAYKECFQNCCAGFRSAGVKVESEVLGSEEFDSSTKNGTADIWFCRVEEDKNCCKAEHYMTGGALNISRISDPGLDSLLLESSNSIDLTERKKYVADALLSVVSLGVELPVYQQKQLTAFNTGTVLASSVPVDGDAEGCRYILKDLMPAE